MSSKVNLCIPVLLEKHYLYNNEDHFGEYVSGHIVSMTAHPGKRPVFDFLIEGEGIFCDLPITAFYRARPTSQPLDISEEALNPERCPEDVSGVYAFTYDSLGGEVFSIFARGMSEPITHAARYVTSVEFPRGNELWHLIEVGGRLAMVANQYMLLGHHSARPRYKRLERDYSAL